MWWLRNNWARSKSRVAGIYVLRRVYSATATVRSEKLGPTCGMQVYNSPKETIDNSNDSDSEEQGWRKERDPRKDWR